MYVLIKYLKLNGIVLHSNSLQKALELRSIHCILVLSPFCIIALCESRSLDTYSTPAMTAAMVWLQLCITAATDKQDAPNLT